jgi:pimeloyl-ACP methyl ester carboxylesterase
MRSVFVKVVNESYEHQLTNLEAPVDLIWGEDDQEVPFERAVLAHRVLRESGCEVRLERVGGVGHDLPLLRPDVLRRAVERMLGESGQ